MKKEDPTERPIHTVEELELLRDLAVEISTREDSQQVMESIINRARELLDAEEGIISLLEPGMDEDSPTLRTLVRAKRTMERPSHHHLADELVNWMRRHKQPLALGPSKYSSSLDEVRLAEETESLIAVPLLEAGSLVGVLAVVNKRNRGFAAKDITLLSVLAGQSVQVLQKARAREREVEIAKMQHEVDLSASIQRHLLPSRIPEIIGYDLSACAIQARGIGGDYYDFLPRPGSKLLLCLGDVSGKGLPAALLMANLQATIRTLAANVSSLADIAGQANQLLFESTASRRFVTLFLAELMPESGKLTFCNAGHNPPLVFRGPDNPESLPPGGIVLGSFGKNIRYPEGEVLLASGDMLVVYSDGLTEAVNGTGEEFGVQRLKQTIAKNYSDRLDDQLATILRGVEEFSQQKPQQDDITLLMLRRH